MSILNAKKTPWNNPNINDLLTFNQLLTEQKVEDYQNPALALYFLVSKILKSPEETTHFQQLKAQLNTGIEFLKARDALDIFVYAQNFCIQKINSGQESYFQELFDLYGFMLKEDVLLEHGFFDQRVYGNIILVASRLGQFEWAAQFVEDYRDKLPKHQLKNAYNYNHAFVQFQLKNYDKVLDLLQVVEFTDKIFKYNSRILLAKSFFELKDWWALENTLDAFRIFLLRKKNMPDGPRKAALNWVRLLKKLGKIEEQQGLKSNRKIQEEKARLKSQVVKSPRVAEKKWLLEKL